MLPRSIWGKIGLLAAGAIVAGCAARVSRRQTPNWYRKVALITGGARGLGLVLARELGEAGAKVVICSRDTEQLERAYLDLRSRNISVGAIECDVTDRDSVKRMVRTIEQRWGPVELLINNAGVIQVGPFDSLTEDDFAVAMKTHFWAPLHAMLEVLPSMRERHSGHIVNIASVGGKVSMPHLIPYNSSKFALVGLSEGIAAEVAKDGVDVTTICPGLMRTGSPRNALFKGHHRNEYAWFSILGSLPGLSVSAEYAAKEILAAAYHGQGTSVVGIAAKFATLMHDLFPHLTVRGLGLVNRLLPAYGGIGQSKARGSDSESMLSPLLLTGLTEQAALKNNEL